MRKFLALFFSLAIALLAFLPSFFPFALKVSADAQTIVNFNLTCDDANEVNKETGDIITVTFTLENATDENAAYTMSSLANEIYFDHTFFEFVEGSETVETGLNLTTSLKILTGGEQRVYFNGFYIPAKQYAAKQVIGRFQLKVVATEGSSTIRGIEGKMVALGNDYYGITSTNLTVNIGDAPPVVPLYSLSFETNGGNVISAIEGTAGTLIDLSTYTPEKNGYTFDGWYSDMDFINRIQSVELNGNTTIYAKWVEEGSDTPPSSDDNPNEDEEQPGDSSNEKQPDEDNGFDFKMILIILAIIAAVILLLFILLCLFN